MNLKAAVCRLQSILQRLIRCVRRENIQRISRLARIQQADALVARVLILLDGRHKFLILRDLVGNDQRLHRFHGALITGKSLLTLRVVVRRTGRRQAEHQLQIFSPFGIDAVANVANLNQGGKMVSADNLALGGNSPESDERESAQQDAQTAHNAESDGELAGDGKIAQPLHAGNPF